ACWTDQDLRHIAGPVDCPLLVIAGEYDFYLPQELLDLTAELIPNCETRRLPGIGHYPHFEDPGLTVDLIDEFGRRSADTNGR
ncbi:MAG: alpha/beta hydrolase, partial [Salinisphaera sp.]|nr:alpha/beta hydrolase [Salinisphaera sp.]